MKIYLAASYSRRHIMLDWADALRRAGHVVTSRWITGIHEELGWTEATYAAEDIKDLKEAAAVISLTEPAGTPHSRGGRHVEFGLATAWGLICIIVGPPENCFHCLPHVWMFDTIDDVIENLDFIADREGLTQP